MNSKNEKDVNTFTIHGKHCMGCTRRKKDIMISCSHGNKEIVDLFFTDAQARELLEKLTQRLEENNQP